MIIQPFIRILSNTMNHELNVRIAECRKTQNKHLNLSKLELLAIPPLIDVTHIESLDLSENKIKKIENLDNLYLLRELKINKNLISQIENLERLESLESLSLTDNQIEEIKNLNNLTNLITLNLSNNQIQKIKNLNNLDFLVELNLGSNEIKKLEGLDKLNQLKNLLLYQNQINEIENLQYNINLTCISLGLNNISKIGNLEKLIKLETLRLHNNNIIKIENLDKNINLTELTIHDNLLSNIYEIKNLFNLKRLYLGRNKLHSLKGIEGLTKLESFNCEKNNINDITPLEKLYNINYLILSKNNISSLQSLKNLKNLKNLDLSENSIYDPSDLEIIKIFDKLEIIKIDKNPIWKEFDIYLDSKWDRNHFDFLKIFLNDYKNYSNITLPTNVILIGNHAAGKTTLLNILTKKNSKKESSTHGLQIRLSPQKIEKFPLAVYYDFGGQDFYHGIYRLFLKQDAIKIIVINPENNKNEQKFESDITVYKNQKYTQNFSLDYWGKQIEYFQKNNLISNNQNKKNIYLIQSHYKSGQKKYWEFIQNINNKNLEDFFSLDLGEEKSNQISLFKKSFLYKIKDKSKSVKMSKVRIKLMQDILNKNKNEIEPISILDLKNQYSDIGYTLDSFKFDLEQLNTSGLILYDKKISNGEYVWLNPKSLVEDLYKRILSEKIIRNSKNQGIIKKEDFIKLNINPYTVELLEYYNIIFKHTPLKSNSDLIEYIIPNYLPLINEENPAYIFSTFGIGKPTYTLKFMKFFPMGMINHLICFFGRQPDYKLFWRDTVIFTFSEGTQTPYRIIINLDFSKLLIQCYIQGNKNEFHKVCKYIFYCLLRFYWDFHALDSSAATYQEFFNLREKNEPINLKKVWKPFLHYHYNKKEYNNFFIPNDLYISLDEVSFIKYHSLLQLNPRSTTINAHFLNNNNYEFELNKFKHEIPVKPFNIFTEKEFIDMKRVFISYSRMDVEYKNELIHFLKPTIEVAGHEVWDCGELEVGKWNEQIQSKLEQADLVIFMLSMSFFKSEYILEQELIPILKAADENRKQIMCVVVKSFPWASFANLGQKAKISLQDISRIESSYQGNNIAAARAEITNYQFLPYKFHFTSSINNEKVERITPLSNLSAAERDEVYVDIVERVIQILKI